MAKVYSWEISNGVYAYIVDPSNTNKALVSRGEITNQKQLQVITDWAQNATDTQYDAQFEKMVTECANKGYSVQFEDASVYRGVSTTCDNLRGPAGRGISTIEYLRSLTDDDGTFSVYTIKYDDGTDGTLKIREGRDGKDGIDGTPGAPGDAGISSKLIMIYTSGVDADGNIIIPERPVGGSYNFISNEFVCPEGWSRNDGDDGSLTPPIWQSTRTFASTEASSDRQWSAPVQITGENGKPGEDGTSTEFIYFLGSNPPRGEALPSENIAGFVPVYESWGTTASPEGVDEDNKTEYCYTRTKNKETNVWGEWNGPTIWSKYGENGQDGDGVQYIFLKNKGQAPQNPTPFGYDAFDSTDPKIKEIFENYQNKDIEWLPPTEYQYTNLYGTDVVFKAIEELPEGSEKEPAGVWTDDPTDVDSDFQFIWVTSRKYRKSPDSGKKMWTKFSDPTLWAKFGQDGKNATSIRRLYKLTSSTGTVPDLPEDPTMTADWGTGFPKDYKYGENVVWATEAEIWAHDFEFVYSYRKVSEVDKDGNVVPPKDATNDNSLEVPYIPDSQKGYEGIEYLIDEYDGHYYKWDGGWCEPFLVTGVKGDPGDPIDYNTYVFAFGYTEYPPAPPTGNSPAFPGESMGENKILVQWYDFPDTSLYRDGIQSNGVDMRWFQCEGQVDGYTKQIKVDDTGKLKWGTVTPCNPRDGEGKTGPYYQFLFGITKDDKEPPKNFIVDGKWERRPAYYVNNEQYGWFDTDDKMPAIPAGGAMWQIWGLIDPETDTVLEVNGKGWNGPRRISGEKGEQGLQGPAGLRGVSGLPGAAQHTMYCLGTYGKDKSEYYFDTYTNPDTDKMGDGYFGDKDFQGKTIEDLEKKGWYTTKNMPYSDVLKVVNDQEFENAYKNPENQGRVIRYIRNTADSTNGSTFVNTTHQYFLVGRGGGYYIQLTGLLSEKESEEFDIYVWCIQGNDKWTNGKSAFYKKLDGTPEDANDNNTQPRNDIPATKVDNYKYLRDVATNEYYTWVEIDGGSVEHIYEGIEWSSPFKLQGTNGLRGLAGNRGQVVYPMGVYNHEEVYVTTETKAPYVYDPNDGLFYVYNIVGQPWVGRLPGYNEETREYDDTYKYIMIHPDDAEVNFKEVDYDPTTQRNEVPGYKYLRYNGNYYTWSGSAYVMASKYKYSDDGGLTWMTDQQGDTPANNFANAGTGMSPAWVRFESFQALYTSIGIIANGMIGSAVYNNEFMFSQQGINKQGEKTNYAVVSGKPGDNDSGFLSGYEFDESGYKVSLGEGKGYIVLHWKYKNTPNYINDTAVNPYEKNENGEYIHAFMPNVCINFSTGQMWLQCGKLRFGQVDSGTNVYTQEEVDRNVEEELRKQKEVIDEQIAETQRELDEMTQKLDDWDNDGLLNPTELKLLKEEYQTIKDEYASITGQAATVSISSSAYTSTYNKVINMTDNYYLNPANATATTSTDGSSFVSGGDCVVIITDSSNSYWYGWYQKYYEDRQTLLQAVSNKLNEKIGDVHNEITAATESLSKTIAANKKAIEEQVDKRADSYYQDADPSSTWQVNDSSITATYAEYRVGDLWYDTGDKKSYTFAKGAKGDNAGKTSNNSALSGYYWAESDVPAGVYNAINGRSKIFIEKPVPPYFSGDLWFVENNSYKDTAFVGGTGITSGTCMVCITTNDSENAQFKPGDWGRRDRYADEAQLAAAQKELEDMTQQLDDWDNDGLLSPAERKILESEYDSIIAEYPSIIDQAKDVSLDSADTAVTTSEHYNAYTTYTGTTETVKNVITNYYLNPANATATTSTDGSSFVSGGDCVVIITGTTNTTKGYGWIKQYYEDRQTLLKCISEKLNNNINEVHNEITAATKSLSDTIAANQKTIQEQVDKRADSYYQDADPSNVTNAKWQTTNTAATSTYAEYRLGDLWYDTGDKKSYTFAKRNSDGKMPTAGKASDNSVLSGYYWAESDVPASVYSSIKGRSKIFVSKPTEEYHVGDLWFLEKDYADTFYGCTEKTTMASGTIMVAVISGTTYAAGNWGRRDRYADEAELINAQAELIAMNEKLTDWASDNKINESERTALKRELESIEAEYSSITGQALTVSVSSADYDTAYTNAVNVFNYYITAATDTNGCVDIVSGTTDTTKGYGWIKNYYEKRQTLLQSISDKLNGNIDNVSQKTLLAIGRLDAFSNDNYISPEERRSLKETYDGLSSEYSSITGQSKTLGLTGTTAYTDYTTWKTRAENALKYYSSTANTITDATSDYYGLIKIEYTGTGTTNVTGYGEGAKHYGNIAEYYKKKDTLQQKITEKLNQKIDDIEIPNIPDTEWLTNQFESGTTDYYGGAVLSNFLGVKNQDGDIAAFLNGSSDSAELKSSDGSSIMMLGVGVKGGVANNITLYPWTCSETVEDGYTTLYTTIDYSVSANAASVKDGAEITTYVYSNGNIINAPGFSYLKNPETSSSESSSTEQTKTLYRSVNSEANDKSGYVYSRATSLSNKNENAVKFTPTRIYSDGTVIINNLITSGGEFNGEINATGQFNGIVSSNKGYLNYYNINRSVVKNSDIILRHDFEETDTDTYENYNTLTCTDRNNNVLIKMGPASLEQNNQRYTVGVSTISSYHKNHNGNDNGQWYGTNNSWNSMCSFKVNGSEQITIPSVSMYIWIWTSGRKVVKNPYYGLRVAFYSGSTLVSSTALRSSTTVSPYKGGGKGGYSYFSVNTSAKTLTVPSSGVNKVVLEYNWKMHLHTYAWLGADKSAGEITITPNSNVLVENGQRRNIIEVGGNGMRIMNGSKDKPLFFEVMPHGITMERGDAGIRVSYDPDGDGDSGIFIKIPGQQGYRELYVGSDNVLKLYTSITDFK